MTAEGESSIKMDVKKLIAKRGQLQTSIIKLVKSIDKQECVLVNLPFLKILKEKLITAFREFEQANKSVLEFYPNDTYIEGIETMYLKSLATLQEMIDYLSVKPSVKGKLPEIHNKPLAARPIMILLKNLICNKQNTVMTNAQIIDILQQEFGIDIDTHHKLQVDIFMKIIKKYMKDWPQWEELERVSARLHSLEDYEAVQKVLNHNYNNLKQYLGVMLNIAKDAVADAEYEDVFNEQKDTENDEANNVVMEVLCSRDQLNHLIYRKPKTDLSSQYKTTIFNASTIKPSRIQCSMLSLEQILNLWCFKISICLPWFVYYRELVHNYEHTLVNKARKSSPDQNNTLPTSWQMKSNNSIGIKYPWKLHKTLNEIKSNMNISQQNPECREFIEVLFRIIMSESQEGLDKYEIPCVFRKYCNNYKYVRYLSVDNREGDENKFDLQLEETVSPMIQYFVCKATKNDVTVPTVEEWLKIECLVCKVKFAGSVHVQDVVINHYRDHHVNNEPDWQCSRCEKMFSADFLAKNKWHHAC